MKAQTKALIAAVVVLALALSAVSGITYSWFSDSESGDIKVSTGTVDLNATITVDGQSVTNNTVEISDILPGMTKTVNIKTDNKSSDDVLYRIYAVYDKTNSTITPYDELMLELNGKQFHTLTEDQTDSDVLVADQSTSSSTKRVYIMEDWTELAKGTNVGGDDGVNIYIAASDEYGGSVSEPIRSYASGGLGKTEEATDTNGYIAWAPDTSRSVHIKFVIQAVQGDYIPAVSTTEATAVSGAITATATVNQKTNTVSYTSSDSTQGVVSATVSFKGTTDTTNLTLSVSDSASTGSSGFSINDASTLTLSLGEGQNLPGAVEVTVKVKGALTNPAVVCTSGSTPERMTVTGFYYTTDDANNTYTVVKFTTTHFSDFAVAEQSKVDSALSEAEYQAKVGGVYYKTLADALAAEGSTVEVLSDASLSETLIISKDTVLVGNGNTITFGLNDKISSLTGNNKDTAGVTALSIGSNVSSLTIRNLTIACSSATADDNRTYGINAAQSGTALTLVLDNVTIKDFGYKGLFVQNRALTSATITGCTFDNTSSCKDPAIKTVTDSNKGGITAMGGDHALQFDLRSNNDDSSKTPVITIKDCSFIGDKNGALAEISVCDSYKTANTQFSVSGCTFSSSVSGSLGNIAIGSTPYSIADQNNASKNGGLNKDGRILLQDFTVDIVADGVTDVCYRGAFRLADTADNAAVRGYEMCPVVITLQNGAGLESTSSVSSEKTEVSVKIASGSATYTGAKEGITLSAASGASLTGGVARIGSTYYATLADALCAAAKGSTVELVCDYVDGGIGVFKPGDSYKFGSASGKDVNNDLILELNGHAYTFSEGAVGSPNTVNQALHFEQGYTITIRDGTIDTLAGQTSASMLIQDYANITFDNIVLDGTNVKGIYASSNNNGKIVFIDSTVIAPADGVALDVYSFGSYTGANVTLSGSTSVQGKIEIGYSSGANTDDLMLTIVGDNVTLSSAPVKSGVANDDFVSAHITISGSSKTSINEFVTEATA